MTAHAARSSALVTPSHQLRTSSSPIAIRFIRSFLPAAGSELARKSSRAMVSVSRCADEPPAIPSPGSFIGVIPYRPAKAVALRVASASIHPMSPPTIERKLSSAGPSQNLGGSGHTPLYVPDDEPPGKACRSSSTCSPSEGEGWGLGERWGVGERWVGARERRCNCPCRAAPACRGQPRARARR
eukprot:4260281-Prymnesium_polylepis.2